MNAWEKRKLGDLSTIRRGASPRPINSPEWFSDTSSVGWLRISDVTEQNGRIYSVAQHLSEKGQKKTLVLTKRHLILSIAATVGKPVQNYTALGIHDGFIVFMSPKFDLDFMFYFLEKYQPQWMRFGQPGSQVNLNSELVRNLEIRLPRRDEQEQVSKILLKLDNLIAATQGKLDQLEMVKKALLQHLFDQSMRFKGYSDPWEKRKLGNFVEEFVEKTTAQNQYPVLTSSQKYGIVLQSDYFSNRQITTNQNIGYFVLPRNYFTYRSRSDNGIFKFNRNEIVYKGIISYFYPVFKIKKGNGDFFLELLNYSIKKQVDLESVGTGQRVLSFKKFKNISARVPEITEQEMIGQLCKKLRDLIAATQSKLSSLKSLKKALLQGLFI
ncbi:MULTISPECIES: restriction endonuclease subunit S [Lacticaseibacillus]|uniref:restriction endonuclease subunit S n=1 Tax=Lacticaseibacillus TaxID=2759736 RepID=UPI00063DD5D9|nr:MULTISPECIES: restriction endonuclease subunit S [Lacticaseibacillus]KLI76050.1 hypothetical protein AAW28_06630 [Lacticaseibacillus casei]